MAINLTTLSVQATGDTSGSINKLVGARLRELRAARDITAARTAHIIGLPAQEIARIEAGERRLSGEQLVALAIATDSKLEFFFAPDSIDPSHRKVGTLRRSGQQPLLYPREAVGPRG